MTDDPRDLIERRRLRRRLGLWRLAAIGAALLAVGVLVAETVEGGRHVALVEVVGPIFDDPERDRFLRELARDEDVAGVLLRINSPGGSVAGSEALFEALRALAQAKPLVAAMGEVAASGGYIAALAADRVIARGGTITGSIGVVAEFPNVEGLLETLGVGVARVASDPLKAEPSPFREPDPAVLAQQATLIADSYEWFIGLVAERRGLDEADARRLGDGRVYTGRQAQEAELVDALGGEPEARAWLAETHDVATDLPLRRREPQRADDDLLSTLLGGARRLSGGLTGGAGARLMAIMR